MPQETLSNCNSLFLSGETKGLAILINIPLVILLLYIFSPKIKKNKLVLLGLSFVLLGGGMNIYERIAAGCVLDNISFFGLLLFNLWDILVMSGILILVICVFVKRRQND